MAKVTAKYLESRIRNGIEDWGGTTSDDFKAFAREFKSFMQAELKKIGGTNYKQSNGHYYVSGFFTYNEQAYYFSFSDVRYGNYGTSNKPFQLLIRTAKDYNDYTGGCNHFVTLADGMLQHISNGTLNTCFPVW